MSLKKWTLEALKQSAYKYKKVKDWRINEPSAYSSASQKGLLKELTAHMSKKIIHGYWTKDKIIDAANRYKTIKEWIKQDKKSYYAARRLNILAEASAHMERLGSRFSRCIYSIEIFDQKIIYIGLTYSFKRRIRDHLKSKRFSNLIEIFGKESINAKQLTSYMPNEEARKKEAEILESFRQKNYKILNKAKAGSLGGNVIKWTKKAILENAQQYSDVMKWARANGSSYAAASSMGILAEATNHMTRQIRAPGTWNKEEIKAVAKKYTQVSQWAKFDQKSYAAASRLGILNDQEVCGHFTKNAMPIRKWTKQNILAESKKYSSKSEWKRESPGSYKAAATEDYFVDITSKMNRPSPYNYKWNKENILLEAKKFSNKAQWKKESPGSYQAARKKGYLKEAATHMKVLNPKGKWFKTEEVIKEAKKYASKSEWNTKSSGSYEAAKRLGIFSEASIHMKRPSQIRTWTKEAILIDAKKYSFKTQWNKSSPGAYEASKKKNCFIEATSHMKNITPKRKWIKKNILEEAQKYLSLNQWKKESPGSYQAAKKLKCLEEAKRIF